MLCAKFRSVGKSWSPQMAVASDGVGLSALEDVEDCDEPKEISSN